MSHRCKQQIRNPSTPEERAVNAAGWTITKGRGETQSSGDLVLVKGQTSFDGMCRPVQYQQFVFVNGVFAGTISPNLMNSSRASSVNQLVVFMSLARVYWADKPFILPVK